MAKPLPSPSLAVRKTIALTIIGFVLLSASKLDPFEMAHSLFTSTIKIVRDWVNVAAEDLSTSPSEPTRGVSQIGRPIRGKYFEVTVHDVLLKSSIETGNPYSSKTAPNGTRYAVLEATFKNIDNESRMIDPGELLIEYQGQQLRFDKTETILAEGWNVALQQINPLTSYSSKVVFAIPTEAYGPVYYKLGRSEEIIYLGELPRSRN